MYNQFTKALRLIAIIAIILEIQMGSLSVTLKSSMRKRGYNAHFVIIQHYTVCPITIKQDTDYLLILCYLALTSLAFLARMYSIKMSMSIY